MCIHLRISHPHLGFEALFRLVRTQWNAWRVSVTIHISAEVSSRGA